MFCSLELSLSEAARATKKNCLTLNSKTSLAAPMGNRFGSSPRIQLSSGRRPTCGAWNVRTAMTPVTRCISTSRETGGSRSANGVRQKIIHVWETHAYRTEKYIPTETTLKIRSRALSGSSRTVLVPVKRVGFNVG